MSVRRLSMTPVATFLMLAGCCSSPPAETPLPFQSHCEAITAALGTAFKENELECLDLPGTGTSGVYGPARYPNENTLEMGFGGTVPPGVIGKPQSGGTYARSFEAKRLLTGSAELDLQSFFGWLPSVKLSANSDTKITVAVRLNDLEVRRIHGVRGAIEDALAGQDKLRQRLVERMRADMCRDDYVVSTMAIVAKPVIVIRSSNQRSINSTTGWQAAAGFSVDAKAADAGEVTLAATEPVVFAIQKRRSAEMLGPLCDAPTSCVFDVAWNGYKHKHASPPFVCKLPPGEKVRATFDGYPLVTSQLDNKVWNARINMSIHENGGGCTGSASACRASHGATFPAPPNWTHFTIFGDGTVPANGLSEWVLTLEHCQTGPHDALCGIKNGTLRIELIR